MAVRLFATASTGDDLSRLTAEFRSRPEVHVVGVGTTGRETVAALREEPIDALLFSPNLADIARVIRISGRIPMNSSPALVVAAESISHARRATSLAYGFDSILPTSVGAEVAANRLIEIVDGQHRLTNETPVDRQTPGLLARALVADDPVDREIADLVGSGLDDDDIARVTGRSIQDVRNRIEHIIDANRLSTRTHLALLRAAQINVPDFS